MLSLPQGVVVDNTGFIYITELGGHRFRKFGPRGQFVFCMGGPSGSLARFSSPTALCMDAYHHLYIADTDNGRITCYSATGHWRTDYHSPTPGAEFRRPQGVAVDQQGRIYVADTLNHRIVRLTPDGALDIAFGKPGPAPGELAEPRGLAADGDGGLWVADSGNDRVQKFDEEGGLVCCFPERPTPGLDLSTPSAVAVDGQGGIYVSDTMNHRLRLARGTVAAGECRREGARAAACSKTRSPTTAPPLPGCASEAVAFLARATCLSSTWWIRWTWIARPHLSVRACSTSSPNTPASTWRTSPRRRCSWRSPWKS
jgi:DNA-binding beta-propeller fold protein YncE